MEIHLAPVSMAVTFISTYPHPDVSSYAGFVELYSVFPDGSGLQNLTIQNKPDTFDPGVINLGVRRIGFQGDYLTHYFLAL